MNVQRVIAVTAVEQIVDRLQAALSAPGYKKIFK